ncbi:MAG: YdcH family protein [Burkholderiaceae bacterium]|jgi:uncharacterized protein YdcH (DUF465 family)|nr:YdcH family protein [Burkholderiaceae bacterium]
MFPEYRELISSLKSEDAHFTKLFERHNDLDHQIKRMEEGTEPGSVTAIEQLKKEKLQLKDQIYTILRKADSKN